MTLSKQPIPEGFHTITPAIVVRDAARAIDFYKRALGAEELMRMAGPDGKGILHAELKIGDSIFFLSDEWPMSNCKAPQTLGGSTGVLNLYVKDIDTAFQRAVDAGGKVTMPLADMFWGDRYGQFVDPFGHTWAIGMKKEELTQEEIEQRAKNFFANMPAQRKSA